MKVLVYMEDGTVKVFRGIRSIELDPYTNDWVISTGFNEEDETRLRYVIKVEAFGE
jgi:hypothetical protein